MFDKLVWASVFEGYKQGENINVTSNSIGYQNISVLVSLDFVVKI